MLNNIDIVFYDNSILSGTKIGMILIQFLNGFYDNSILSGTKITGGFMAQYDGFYDNSILSGTKIYISAV